MFAFLLLASLGCRRSLPDTDAATPVPTPAEPPAATADTGVDGRAWPTLAGWTHDTTAIGPWGQHQIVWTPAGPGILASRHTVPPELVWLTPDGSGGFDEQRVAIGGDFGRAAVLGDEVHVAFVDVASATLRYAVGPGSWTVGSVDDARTVDPAVDIAVHPTLGPTIAFGDPAATSLVIAYPSSPTWHTSEAPLARTNGTRVRIEITPSGRRWTLDVVGLSTLGYRLMPYEGDAYGLATQFQHPGAWDDLDLDLDPHGRQQLVLGHPERPCRWQNGSINVGAETDPLPGTDCRSPSIQVDALTRTQISWTSTGEPGIHLARWGGLVWQHLQPVGADDFDGFGASSMVLDPDGVPHFSFLATPLGGSEPVLVYATWAGF
ncbi:MAG: hypothetical protein R3F61_17595 [Myxococcota bacterium]